LILDLFDSGVLGSSFTSHGKFPFSGYGSVQWSFECLKSCSPNPPAAKKYNEQGRELSSPGVRC
jgi:hypothetical protein